MKTARILGTALAAALLLSGDAQAQESGSWMAWSGCWQPREAASAGESSIVCMTPGTGAAEAVVLRLEDGRVVGRESIIADGVERAVDRGGCTGTEQASWSGDGRRIFLSSKLDCAGTPRVTTGVMAMLNESEWIEVTALETQGGAVTTSIRYVPPVVPAAADAGIESFLADNALAIEMSRRAAAALFTLSDAVEASKRIHPEALRTLIAERGTGYDLDAETLIRLADAGLPGEVTDLMIALSYPERFQVARAGTPEPLTRDWPATERSWGDDPYGPYRTGRRSYASCDSRFMYGYDSRYDSRYDPRYGSRYNDCGRLDRYGYYGRPGNVVITEKKKPDVGGKIVKGSGYRPSGRGEAGAASVGRSTDRSGGNASSGGTSGNSSDEKSGSGRTAKPRGNN